MKCYYEVLDVPRDADDAQIKSAYRKLALKWHPDKNLDSTESAKEQFQVVQQAYEVLSDRQERAWYDKHREQIIRGASSEFQDDSLDVFQYFTTACFKGYGDDEEGFYAVYRRVFEKIAKEDMEFMEDKQEFCEIPSFGSATTSFERVAEFYAYWSGYSTRKSYVWLDPYDIKDIKERRYLRLVEKENKKARQAAKKERNEEVRNLVAFVRKRDKRVQAQKKAQELKSLQNKKKTEELRKQKKLERQEELNNSKEQPEWAKFDNVKSELEEIEKNLAQQFGEAQSDTDDDDDINNLYCVACTKLFKTPKAFQNHESSKKHKDNIELLKQQMLDDDELDGECDDLEDYDDNEDESHGDIDRVIEDSVQNEIASESDDLGESEKIKLKQKKKQKSLNHQEPESYPESPIAINDYSSDDLDFIATNKPKKKSKKKSTKLKQDLPEANFETILEAETSKPRKVKKDTKGKKREVNEDLDNIDLNHNCVSCKSSFPSKNKLFDHLKKTGHGVYIPPGAKSNKKKGNKEN